MPRFNFSPDYTAKNVGFNNGKLNVGFGSETPASPKDETIKDLTITQKQLEILKEKKGLASKAKAGDMTKPVLFRVGLENVNELDNLVFGSGKYDIEGITQSYFNLPTDKSSKINRAMDQAVDAWLRFKTGAVAPQSEVDKEKRNFGIRPWDSPEVAKSKINALRQVFEIAGQEYGQIEAKGKPTAQPKTKQIKLKSGGSFVITGE